MSDFEDVEFNSSDFDDAVSFGSDQNNQIKTGSEEPIESISSDPISGDKGSDDFMMPPLPKASTKNLSVINFSALKPANTQSSITISDATNESLNFSRSPLIPARLSNNSNMTNNSQSHTSVEENKPKFDLPPLFDDIDLSDHNDDAKQSDDSQQPNLGPIQFPLDIGDDDNSEKNHNKSDSITLNSITNNSISHSTSLFKKDAPFLQPARFQKPEDHSSDASNDKPFNNHLGPIFDNIEDDNESMQPNLVPDVTISRTNESITFGGMDDDFGAHPLIPARKRSGGPTPSPSINDPQTSSSNIPTQSNITFSDNTSAIPAHSTNQSTNLKISPVSDSDEQIENIDDDFENIDLDLPSDTGPSPESKVEIIQSSQNFNTTEQKDTTPVMSDNFISVHSSAVNTQKTASESEIPPQSKLAPSSRSNNNTTDNFMIETTEETNNSFFQTMPDSMETFQTISGNTNSPIKSAKNSPQKSKLSNISMEQSRQTNENIDIQQTASSNLNRANNQTNINSSNKNAVSNQNSSRKDKSVVNSSKNNTTRNSEKKHTKIELGESVQKVKQNYQSSSAKKKDQSHHSQEQQLRDKQAQRSQRQQPPTSTTFQNTVSSHHSTKNQQQYQQHQVISPNQGFSSPTSSSSSSSFNDNSPCNNTQTIVHLQKNDDQLSSVSLHLSSDPASFPKPRVTKMAIEIGIENAFDHASSQFQRLFLNEFSALMRPSYQMPYNTELDTFIDSLSTDISKELKTMNDSYSSRQTQAFEKRINTLFTQCSKDIHLDIENSYERERAIKEKAHKKLRNLQSAIEDLNDSFTTNANKAKKTIDHFIKDSSLTRSNRVIKAQILQKELRELTLERLHLESKVNRQLTEFENLERSQNEMIYKQITINEQINGDTDDYEGSVYAKKISHECAIIGTNIDKASYDNLIEMLNDTIQQINKERAWVNDEFSHVEGLSQKIVTLAYKNSQNKTNKIKSKEHPEHRHTTHKRRD
ncbi:hypothetical protein TRFO_21091 [Tritrichomonas foetus]|uniref:Uncharacterized protein n=1 Tax=Tritrichomonas foetus TaxID=1144522 RepID=A0A1J4KFV5_9EUKA|nr:hypothetical protein TRFO_21091 [Tritrichomonas foetus]|eukprot:OHT09824.1 hypothetical protein TRFO_21091 [Tritrichomonas foetus]